MSATRILICEDDPRFSKLLVKVLSAEEDLQVVGQFPSGEEACRAVHQARVRPDLLLLDLELPGMDGIDVIEDLLPSHPGLEVLVLTSFADETKVFEAMRAGAAGYLVKGIAPGQLKQAIRDVLRGGTVIEARLARRVWNYFASVKGRSGQSHGLTAEELEVLTLVGRGLSNPETATALGASRRTIKTHLERIYRKLEVSGRVEATVKALAAGLIEL